MRIKSVNIPSSGNDGLDTIKMDKLGQVVLIAGKNGSGKTRILNKITTTLTTIPTSSTIETWKIAYMEITKR